MDAIISLAIVAASALANGLVTWGVVKTKLQHLDEGVNEAKATAIRAHTRIDRVLEGRR